MLPNVSHLVWGLTLMWVLRGRCETFKMIAAFVGVIERQLVCVYKKYNFYSKGQVTFIYIAHLKQQKVIQRCIGILGVQPPKRQKSHKQTAVIIVGVLLCLLRFISVTYNMYSLGAQGALLCTKNKQKQSLN